MLTKSILALAAVAGAVFAAPAPQDGEPVVIVPIVEAPTPATRTFAFFAGFDAHQGAYKSGKAASPYACRNQCFADLECKTFTYVPQTSTCWLAKTLAIGSAGPSGANFFGVVGACDSPDTIAEINKNSYRDSLKALCGTEYAKYKYALYSDYDLRQGQNGLPVASFKTAAECARSCIPQACSGFTFDGTNCYQSKATTLSASSPNPGKTMGFLGTCESTKALLPAQFKNTVCRD